MKQMKRITVELTIETDVVDLTDVVKFEDYISKRICSIAGPFLGADEVGVSAKLVGCRRLLLIINKL